jgi:hypothetical protein
MKNYLLILLSFIIPPFASQVNLCLELNKGYFINNCGKDSSGSDCVFHIPGDEIAKVVRTDLNAYMKRSPYHLHLLYLQIENGHPTPKNIYKALLKAKAI